MCCWAYCARRLRPQSNPQRQLALLADNTPRTVEGEVVRLGPVRSVISTAPFSTRTHEEHSQQIDVRLRSLPDSTVRITLYAPVEEAFPQVSCGDRVRATLAMHGEERYLDPGVWDAGEYLRSQGIGALASARPDKIAVIAGSPAAAQSRAGCILFKWRRADGSLAWRTTLPTAVRLLVCASITGMRPC